MPKVKFKNLILVLLTVFFAASVFVSEIAAEPLPRQKGNLGIIKGIVRDEAGSPIADAYVSIFRVGTSELLKKMRSAADGSFLTKIIPGTYKVLAIAEGFNAVMISEVEVNRSTELVYKFKLERSGDGNTLPEKRVDRNNSKWRIRAAQTRRSTYQVTEGEIPFDENDADAETAETVAENNTVEQKLEIKEDDADVENRGRRRGQSLVQTYFAGTDDGNFAGINFATIQPLGDNAEIIFSGQAGTNAAAPKRFETNLKFRPNEKNQISIKSSIGKVGTINSETDGKTLGQFSVQALDEWKVRSNVILIFGFDYSRFLGAGNDFSIRPRLGVQFDVNPKTRVRAAFTSFNEEKTWQNAVDLEGTSVVFREPAAVQDFVVENEKPKMVKSSRLEFGIERVLDNKSSIEANVFFDTTNNRGVGLTAFGFDGANSNLADFVANQQGAARGVRFVYSRRINGIFSASAGYAFGSGQKLSPAAVSNPANVFDNDFFQTFYAAFDVDLKTGTQIKTIYRLSPQATVFAIDPFSGRMAIYDPSLSVMITQTLPNWGLPIHAEAVIDARNLFDIQSNVAGEEGSLKLNSQKRMLRGGILVRF